MTGKTSEQSQADTSLLSRRIFSSPPPRRLLSPIAGVSLLSATIVTAPAFTWDALLRHILALALPIYGSAILTLPIARALGGHTFLRRTTLQAFVDGCTVFAILAVVGLAELVWTIARGAPFAYRPATLLYLAFAATSWLRHAVWIATSHHSHLRTLPATAVTPALGFLAVKLTYATSLAEDGLGMLLFLVFLLAGIAFTVASNAPIRHAFGVNGLKLMRHLLEHMTEMSEEARRELESFFDSFAEPAEVRTAAIAFRAPYGTIAVIVATHAHPGPFGRVGGSDLPEKLRTALSDVCKVVLVPHGPSTHDYNPATTTECVKIAAVTRQVLEAAKPVPGGSGFARATVGPATATAQFFGDVAFVTASLAPNPTDDIDTATGHGAIRAAKDAGARDCLFVDAHNCSALAEGLVRFGSTESLAVIEATHKAVALAGDRPATSLRVGLAEGPVGVPKEGIGGQGLQVLVAEADGKRTAYLLFDGNNMVPGLRDEILAAVRETADDGEVLTTDNHSVNATMGGYNPIGGRIEKARVVGAARELVGKAIRDLRPVETVAGSGVVHGLRVFGHENTARLTSSVNATISILRTTAILTLGLALAVSLVLLVLLR
ncbi:MAG TPA: DUF2070 family protein [Thermoplasmata archaeon]|nr:DUF2070 family protein [Thermoplasmata archaeon]